MVRWNFEQPETGDASSWDNTEFVLGCEEIDSAVSVILLSGWDNFVFLTPLFLAENRSGHIN